ERLVALGRRHAADPHRREGAGPFPDCEDEALLTRLCLEKRARPQFWQSVVFPSRRRCPVPPLRGPRAAIALAIDESTTDSDRETCDENGPGVAGTRFHPAILLLATELRRQGGRFAVQVA